MNSEILDMLKTIRFFVILIWVLVLTLVIKAKGASSDDDPHLWNLPPTHNYNKQDALADIKAHTSNVFSDSDLGTVVHESVHQINSEARQSTGKECFYLMNDRIAVLEKTQRTKLSDVAARITTKGPRYQLYFVQQQRDWNNEPLYVLDEFSAYLLGAYERKFGTQHNYTEINDTQAIHEFQHYSVQLVNTIAVIEPRYADFDKLQKTVNWMGHWGDIIIGTVGGH